MDYQFADDAGKFGPMIFAIVVFAAVVVALLLVLDLLPRWGRDRWHVVGFFGVPALLLLIGLVVPLIRTTVLSFMDSTSTKFVGLDNYKWVFNGSDNWEMLLNTLLWVVIVPVASTAIGLLYSVLVDRARFEKFAKSLIFMPMAISLVGASIIWKFMYEYKSEDQQQIGLLNQIFVWLGLKPKNFLLDQQIPFLDKIVSFFGMDPKTFLPDQWSNTFFLLVTLIWVQAGFTMVVLSAAIKAIPAEITEAARLDGVNAWQMFWRVTLPTIRPAVVVVVMTVTIATLKLYDIVRAATGGAFGTKVLAYEMFVQSFTGAGHTGRGSALAVLLFLLVVPIVFYQVRSLRQRQETR